MAAWIRIRIPKTDPDPGGENSAKRQTIWDKKYRYVLKKVIRKKMGNCDFIFIKKKNKHLICL
jgi:hypothetical protein